MIRHSLPNIDDFGPEVLSNVSKIGRKNSALLSIFTLRSSRGGCSHAANFEMQSPVRPGLPTGPSGRGRCPSFLPARVIIESSWGRFNMEQLDMMSTPRLRYCGVAQLKQG